ncbi:MAG: lipid-A-disaccharide synthase, partial [Bdellovibrionales bacterium]|nr:lipid-A-disaccharide synthase [Bdellovibrionales bacterium]
MSEVSQDQIRVLISAGEVSGDQHASLVIEELRRAYPQACFKGMGGASLKAAGVDIIVDAQRYGGKNGFNILDILSSSLYAFWTMLTCLWRWKPKLLILVDYPDFNLRLAFFAKLLGVPVLYHIPPKLWAWRTGRIKRIRKSVDKVACIFPFEANFYKDHKYQNAHYVGHPFADEFPKDLDKRRIKEKFCQTYGLDVHQPLVAVFPGSRKSEVLRHLPILSATIELVRQSVPKVQFVVVRGPGLSDELFSSLGTLKGVVVQSNIQIEAMQAADVGLLKSGTCNVEAAFCKLPFVCMYTTPKISAWIIRRFVKLTEYSLVNIIRKNTVREIMQEEATPENLAGELLKLITNREEELTRVTQGLFEVEQTLRSNDLESNDQSAARNAALLAAELLELRRPERVLSRLISYLGRYKSQFYLSLFCMVLFGASDGAIPFLVKHILDGVFSEQNENLLYVLPVILIVFAVLRAGVDIGQHFILTRIGHNIVRDIRNDTAQHL